MHTLKLDYPILRRGLVVLVAGLVLAGCGLANGKGNVATGMQYQAAGQYRAAYIEAKKVLQNDEKSGAAWLLLGQASLMLGDPKDAQSDLEHAKANGVPQARWVVPLGRALLVTHQFDKLLATLPADNNFDAATKAHVAVLRGDALRGLQQNTDAHASYAAALKSNPKDALALVGMAKLASATNNPTAAHDYVKQALAAAPASPQALVAGADLAFDGGDYAAAESAYEKTLALKKPDWLPQERFYAQARLADAQTRQGQLTKALANITELEKIAPDQPYAHYLHAVVLYKQGHLDAAVDQLQQVLKASANNVPAQMLMGAVNYAKGNYSQAEMYLSNVIGMAPKNASAQKLLALTLYREGRSRQALDTLRPLLPNNPSDAELTALLQRAAAQGIDGSKTVVAGAAVASSVAGADQGPLAQAGALLAQGQGDKAIELLEQTPAKGQSEEAQRATLLVLAYARGGHVDKATATAKAYVARHANDSAAHVLYGTALMAAKQPTQARVQYQKAIALDAKNLAARLSLGNLNAVERQYADAKQQYLAVLKLAPKNQPALLALGQLALTQRNQAEAVKRFQQVIDAAPKSPTGYVALATLYTRSGQFDEAATTAKQLVDAVPNNPAALNALGAAELNAGHAPAALEPLQQAVKLAPTAATFRTNLARAQLVNKDAKAATANLEKVIQAHPDAVEATALLASLKLQQHDAKGALALATALQKQPTAKAQGYSLEGDVYMADKAYAKAHAAYQQGLKVDYARPLVIRSFEAARAAGTDKPDAVLETWLAKHADDSAIRLLLAQYYMNATRNDAAASQYKTVLAAYPANVSALNNLAWIYTQQHNPKAVDLAAKAHKLAPTSPGVADTYGWALITANQPKAALPILNAAAKAAPKVPTIQYHLAVAQARSGDAAAARGTLAALQTAAFPEKAAATKLYQELTADK